MSNIRAILSTLIVTTFLLATATSEAARRSRAEVKFQGDSKPVRLLGGIGLESAAGGNGVSFRIAGFVRPVRDTPIFVGIESGFEVIDAGPFTSVGMPILGSFYYEFNSRPGVAFRPYAGMSLGPWIGVSNANTGLGIFFKPGANLVLTDTLDFNAEARFGAIDGVFVINPQANIVVKL